MREANIMDLGDIIELIGDDGWLLKVRNDIITRENIWIIEEGMTICFQPIGEGKFVVHIYGIGGKTQRDFAVKAGRYMIDKYHAKTFLNFVSRDRMDLRFFMRMIGSKKVGIVGNDILYMSTEHMGIRED